MKLTASYDRMPLLFLASPILSGALPQIDFSLKLYSNASVSAYAISSHSFVSPRYVNIAPTHALPPVILPSIHPSAVHCLPFRAFVCLPRHLAKYVHNSAQRLSKASAILFSNARRQCSFSEDAMRKRGGEGATCPLPTGNRECISSWCMYVRTCALTLSSHYHSLLHSFSITSAHLRRVSMPPCSVLQCMQLHSCLLWSSRTRECSFAPVLVELPFSAG